MIRDAIATATKEIEHLLEQGENAARGELENAKQKLHEAEQWISRAEQVAANTPTTDGTTTAGTSEGADAAGTQG